MSNPIGPHAFPSGLYCEYGMSLRDYFAAQALAGILANPAGVTDEFTTKDIVSAAYRYADLMLAEREQ